MWLLKQVLNALKLSVSLVLWSLITSPITQRMSGEMQSCTIPTGFVLRDFYLLTDTVMLGMVLPNLTLLGGGGKKIADHDKSKKYLAK